MESLSLVDPLEELRRLYRQACLALVAGKTAEADQIFNDVLPTHITTAQRELGHDIAGDDILQAVFADEQRRVRDAEALCELLLPRLQRALSDGSVPSAGRSSSSPPRSEPEFESRPATSYFAGSSPAGAGSSSSAQSIADMLDSMLAQDGAHSRRR